MKLQEDEKIVHELRPEPGILGIWIFTKCLPTTFGGTFLSVFLAFFGNMLYAAKESRPDCGFAAGSMAAFIAAPCIFILAIIYYNYLRRTYVYYITNQRCVFHGGILRRIERSVPYHKITDVEMSQSIVERIFGISSLKIFTPGTASMAASSYGGQRAEILFVGLNDNETPAASINEIIKKFRATGE